MASLYRVRVALTGFPGAPGVMTFAVNEVNVFIPRMLAWLGALAPYIPNTVTMQVESTGDTFESTTGVAFATWTVAPQAAVQGGSTSPYAGPAGVMAEWLTGIHLSGRRLRGRTFIVPASQAVFALDGTIDAGILTTIRAATATFVTDTAGTFEVWQRPRLAKPANGTQPAVTARAGGHGVVTASRVPDKVVVLRSRRD